jgi:hypothetical protein
LIAQVALNLAILANLSNSEVSLPSVLGEVCNLLAVAARENVPGLQSDVAADGSLRRG